MSIPSTALSDHEKCRADDGGPKSARAPPSVEPLVVPPRVAWKMLSCCNTRGYELLADGELESYRDGKSRRITVNSIMALIARRLAAEGGKLSVNNPAAIATKARVAKRVREREASTQA